MNYPIHPMPAAQAPAVEDEDPVVALATALVEAIRDDRLDEAEALLEELNARSPGTQEYCLSKIHLGDGRFGDSMKQYKRHVAQAMRVVHGTVMSRVDMPLPTAAAPSQDATGLRLPPRYRAAYRYILEHLHDNELSVREVAGRLGVTERALQLAFRSHLGVTPAELIRNERMKRIRSELDEASETGGRARVLDVASRWGISNRSTLANALKRAQPAGAPFSMA